MDNVLKSLKIQIKATRKQIARDNKELKDMSASLNDSLSGFDIEHSVGFMEVNMHHMIEASIKLAQLEDTYNTLMYEKSKNK